LLFFLSGTAKPFKLTKTSERNLRENSAEKFETKRDTGNADGFPEEMTYTLTLDENAEKSLLLKRDRAHVLPNAYQQDEAGKFSRRSDTNAKVR
jgi:hypothetical protein